MKPIHSMFDNEPDAKYGKMNFHELCPQAVTAAEIAHITKRFANPATITLTVREAELVRWALLRTQPKAYLGFCRN